MNEQEIKDLIQQTIDSSSTSNQFAVADTSYHTHDGTGSQKVKFLNLSDVPNSYYLQKGKVATVNSTESGLEFDTPTPATVITVKDGTTTVTPTTIIKFTSGATVTNGGGGEADIAISGGGSPGGNNTNIQFNDSGSFGGSDNFDFNLTGSGGGFSAIIVNQNLNSVVIGDNPNNANTTGSPTSVSSNDGVLVSDLGASLQISSGSGGNGLDAGGLSLLSGFGGNVGGSGGNINIVAGDGTNNNPGGGLRFFSGNGDGSADGGEMGITLGSGGSSGNGGGMDIVLGIGNGGGHNGRLNIQNLPTSSAGLSSGDIWNSAGTLKIV